MNENSAKMIYRNLISRYIENFDISAGDTVRYDISISNRYFDIFDISIQHYCSAVANKILSLSLSLSLSLGSQPARRSRRLACNTRNVMHVGVSVYRCSTALTAQTGTGV